ncbi:hypothetical protein [Clostridium sp.]|nr:hypothetical protein [Clostridium sp.]MDY2632540.1 hypothetical protein [Clostridium sp.]
MGIVFLVSLIISVPVLGEMYLPTVMFIILSLVQLILAMLAFFYLKERSK